MNRLMVISARRMASAAPKTSTGIEHAEKARQVAGMAFWNSKLDNNPS